MRVVGLELGSWLFWVWFFCGTCLFMWYMTVLLYTNHPPQGSLFYFFCTEWILSKTLVAPRAMLRFRGDFQWGDDGLKVELGQFPQAKVLRRNDWGWAISNGNVVCCSWAQGSEDIVLVLSQCVQRSVNLLAIFFLDQVGKWLFPTNNFRSKQSKSLKTVQITKSSKKVCKKPDIFHFFSAFF